MLYADFIRKRSQAPQRLYRSHEFVYHETEMTPSYPLGEVIAATTSTFQAECLDSLRTETLGPLPEPPPFGSFVRIDARSGQETAAAPTGDEYDPFVEPQSTTAALSPGDPITLYGVVIGAETGSREPGRLLTAFGLAEEALHESQPQIFELLRTHFSAALIGHSGPDGLIRPYLPPRPPRPHSQVWAATTDETRQLTQRLDFLRPLLAGAGGAFYPADELVAALLRNAYNEAYARDSAFLLRAGRELATLLPLEYDRLRAILSRITG
jgi:hypothetical protein